MESLSSGIKHINEDHKLGVLQVLRVKDRFRTPSAGGWSDVLLNAQFPTTESRQTVFPFEVQMIHSAMLTLRQDLGGHENYAKYRTAFELIELYDGTSRGDDDEDVSETSRGDECD